jgi:hypothetical protein
MEALISEWGMSRQEPDCIEVLRLPNGRLVLRCYQDDKCSLRSNIPEADAMRQIAAWPGLPVYLHRNAAQLAGRLRRAGRKVRWGVS